MVDGQTGEPGKDAVGRAAVDPKHARAVAQTLLHPVVALIVKGKVPRLEFATRMDAQVSIWLILF